MNLIDKSQCTHSAFVQSIKTQIHESLLSVSMINPFRTILSAPHIMSLVISGLLVALYSV